MADPFVFRRFREQSRLLNGGEIYEPPKNGRKKPVIDSELQNSKNKKRNVSLTVKERKCLIEFPPKCKATFFPIRNSKKAGQNPHGIQSNQNESQAKIRKLEDIYRKNLDIIAMINESLSPVSMDSLRLDAANLKSQISIIRQKYSSIPINPRNSSMPAGIKPLVDRLRSEKRICAELRAKLTELHTKQQDEALIPLKDLKIKLQNEEEMLRQKSASLLALLQSQALEIEDKRLHAKSNAPLLSSSSSNSDLRLTFSSDEDENEPKEHANIPEIPQTISALLKAEIQKLRPVILPPNSNATTNHSANQSSDQNEESLSLSDEPPIKDGKGSDEQSSSGADF